MAERFRGIEGIAEVSRNRTVKTANTLTLTSGLAVKYAHELAQIALEGLTIGGHPVRVIQFKLARAKSITPEKELEMPKTPDALGRLYRRVARKKQGLVGLISETVKLDEESREAMRHVSENLSLHQGACAVCTRHRGRLPSYELDALKEKLLLLGGLPLKEVDLHRGNVGFSENGEAVLFEVLKPGVDRIRELAEGLDEAFGKEKAAKLRDTVERYRKEVQLANREERNG